MHEVETLDPTTLDEASFAPWWDVVLAADAAQDPGWVLDPPPETLADLRAVQPRLWTVDLAAVRDPRTGRPVALVLSFLPMADNTRTASVQLAAVRPDARRRGLGTALLDHLRALLDRTGRTVASVEVVEPLGAAAGDTPGGSFLLAAGAVPVGLEVRRTLDLTAAPDPAAPVAAGYELLTWTGATPAELVDPVAVLRRRMSTDAPAEDRTHEPEVWDGDRVRTEDAQAAARGRVLVTTAARHRHSGMLAGYTQASAPTENPARAYQDDTIVVEPHRGHGLGLAMKATNHRALRAASPGSRQIVTWNAGVNAHMIAVNARLGFRPTAQERAFEVRLR